MGNCSCFLTQPHFTFFPPTLKFLIYEERVGVRNNVATPKKLFDVFQKTAHFIVLQKVFLIPPLNDELFFSLYIIANNNKYKCISSFFKILFLAFFIKHMAWHISVYVYVYGPVLGSQTTPLQICDTRMPLYFAMSVFIKSYSQKIYEIHPSRAL